MDLGPVATGAAAYFVASAWESWAHKELLHASRRRINGWKRYGPLGSALRRVRFNHHAIHHSLAKAIGDEPLRIKSKIKTRNRARLEASGYGLTIESTPETIVLFSAVPLTLIVPIFYIFAPSWIGAGFIIALAPFLLTKYVHPVLHAAPMELGPGAPESVTAPSSCRLIRILRAYHNAHHRDPGVNFNLLLGADYLFQSHKSQAAKAEAASDGNCKIAKSLTSSADGADATALRTLAPLISTFPPRPMHELAELPSVMVRWVLGHPNRWAASGREDSGRE